MFLFYLVRFECKEGIRWVGKIGRKLKVLLLEDFCVFVFLFLVVSFDMVCIVLENFGFLIVGCVDGSEFVEIFVICDLIMD